MKPEIRHERILAIVAGRGEASVIQLAEELGTSKETIRRDLTVLEERGFIRKVHGGATTLQTATESAVASRLQAQRLEKERIAAHAARLFKPGDSIFVDAGTTTIAFAAALAKAQGLTVITNCIEVAQRIWSAESTNRVYLLGGEYSGEIAEVLGPLTLTQIRQFRADHAVLTIGALHPDLGIMDFNIDEATIAAAMIAQANRITVLADHTKLGRSALAKVCDLASVSRLVTDAEPSPAIADALARAGVELQTAGGGC